MTAGYSAKLDVSLQNVYKLFRCDSSLFENTRQRAGFKFMMVRDNAAGCVSAKHGEGRAQTAQQFGCLVD